MKLRADRVKRLGFASVIWCVLGLLCFSCSEPGPPSFSEGRLLGGHWVEAVSLNAGRQTYGTYCKTCHGRLGDGRGPLGQYQKPPARDLRHGVIKFGSVPSGALPTDADLARIIRQGIKGSAMLPIPLADKAMHPLLQYLKTFSPRWAKEKAGVPVSFGPNPWQDIEAAQKRGERLYHFEAQCVTCHRAYQSKEQLELYADTHAIEPRPLWRAELSRPKSVDSLFGPLVAPLLHSASLGGGSSSEDLYRSIAAGIGGTAMPTWQGALSNKDIWALVHFVRRKRGDGPASQTNKD
jgi:mono/diheme cytochrome c family protein